MDNDYPDTDILRFDYSVDSDISDNDGSFVGSVVSDTGKHYCDVVSECQSISIVSSDLILRAISVLEKEAEFPVLVRTKISELVISLLESFHLANLRPSPGGRESHIDTDTTTTTTSSSSSSSESSNNATIFEVISVFEKASSFPEPNKTKIRQLAVDFLCGVETAVKVFLCDSSKDDYKGLDPDRDSEESVEVAIRCFPKVLQHTMMCALRTRNVCEGNPTNAKAVPFVPLLARLGVEIGGEHFFEEERGGLVPRNCWTIPCTCWKEPRYNILHCLIQPISQQEEDVCLQTLQRLRTMDLFVEKDIRDYELIPEMCRLRLFRTIFSTKIFQFLVAWNPASLFPKHLSRTIPLANAAQYARDIVTTGKDTIFHEVFEAGMRCHPTKGMCLLFFIGSHKVRSPFGILCGYLTVEVANESYIDPTLARCAKDHPYNPVEAMLRAAMDNSIELDGLYFILRRHPSVVHELLASPALIRPMDGIVEEESND